MCWLGFFFQAEDGIRDLVRSRGLGDVYKRQVGWIEGFKALSDLFCVATGEFVRRNPELADQITPVSYTHLTLPTSDLV